MRSFYCYVRTLDNQFLSCAIAGEVLENLPSIAFTRFEQLGHRLTAKTVKSMRFVADPRNLMDGAGYEEVRKADLPADDEEPEDSDQPPITPCH